MNDTLVMIKEIGSNASIQAASALTNFLHKDVSLNPSFCNMVSVNEIHKNIFLQIEKVGILIFARLTHVLQGELIFVLDEKDAFNLINATGITVNETLNAGFITEMGVSELKELGNMVIGSYLTGISNILKIKIDPPLSTLLSGSLEKIFTNVIYHPYLSVKNLQRCLIQTDFNVYPGEIKGNLSLALTPECAESVRKISLENKQ